MTRRIYNQFAKIVFTAFCMLLGFFSFAQSPFIDNTPGGTQTFTVPPGVTSITVSIWGAGGGGGGSSSATNSGGSGGGGGGACTRTISGLSGGESFSYSVGAGPASAATGAAGGATTFTNVGLSISMTANGGNGGGPNLGAAGTGGTASGGTTNVTGNTGTVGAATGGAGGNSGTVVSIFGAGGAAISNAQGNNGAIPGGAGGGGEKGTTNAKGGAGGDGQVYITYTVPPCSTPTAQPTALILSPIGGGVNGSFTAASPAVDNYLVVRNTSGVAPTPVNGTTYAIGSTALGGTNVVVDNDGNTTFGETGLTAGTTYYYFVYSFNSLCTGGPLYLPTNPLNGNAVPTIAPCTASSSTCDEFIAKVVVGSISNTTTCTAGGYANYTGMSTSMCKGTTYPITITNGPPNYTGDQCGIWVDWNHNGVFTDAGEVMSVAGGVATYTSNITPPAGALTGATLMRVRITYTGTLSPCGLVQYGETEDYTIMVSDLPTISVQPSTATQTPCQNVAATALSVTAAAGTGAISSYKWYSNTTATNSGGTLVATHTTAATTDTYTPSTASVGTLYYYVVVTNAGGCTVASNVSGAVTVNALPTPTVSPTAAVCANTSGVVYTTQSGMTNYVWSVTGGTITAGGGTSDNTATISWGSAGTGHVFINYTNGNGCTAASSTNQSITINTLPSFSGQPSTSSQGYCQDATATSLSVTAAAGSGTISKYEWYSNASASNSGGTLVQTNVTSSTTNSYTPLTATVGTLYYYVVVTNSNGCESTSNVSGGITVNTPPAAPGTPTTNSPQCSGTGVTITANGSAPAGETWYWQGTNATGTSTASPATSTYNATATGTYYISSQNNSSLCWSAATGVSVTVDAAPTVNIQPSTTPQTVCQFAPASGYTIFASAGSGSITTYQWYSNTTQTNSGGSPVGTNSNSFTPSTSSAGTTYYYVVVTNSNGCSVTSNASGAVIVQPLSDAPVVNSPISAGSTSVSGTSTEADGTVIQVYVDGDPTGISTTTVTGGVWGPVTVTALNVGQVVTARATAPGECLSVFSTDVTVTPSCSASAPAAPTSNSPQCSGTGVTITATGSAPAGEDWYWQGTNATGTSQASPATSTYNATATGTYYIRSYDNANSCWSPATGIAVVVTPNNTAGAASSTPTLCINTPMTSITHTTTGATGIGTATGLPAGVSASWSSNTITISGTPSASGTFNYTIPLTGGCGSVDATGTITVTPDNTAGAASSSPTVCINTLMADITHTTTGATGIGTATGLPAGVNASWSSNTITISGTPTSAGTFNYTVPLTGGCGSANATGTITVTPDNTAGAASSSPTLCINTLMADITHTTTGATGIGTATGLPAGVTASWSSNTITISGTPSAAGTFNYTIPLTGGCGSADATGTITVTPDNTAGAASSTPTLCINTPMTSITHTTTGATGIGTVTGLPAGVTASWASNTITISGTPTAAGTFNYSIPLTGGCGSVNATGTINVTPNNTAGAASSSPTVCTNTAMADITHTTTGATGIGTATGLPAGVTASWSSNTITISGTPTAAGTYNYTIPLTGGCGAANATGTITVTGAPDAAGAISGASTVTQGQNGVAYSVAAISGATSYVWTYSGTGATINGTGNSVTINFSVSATNGDLTVYGTNGCGNGTISASFPVTVNPGVSTNITWTGATNTDWNTASNWSPAQVPGALDNVTIPFVPNQPILPTASGIKALTINSSAIVTLNADLTADGDVVNDGTVTGTSTFNIGTSAHNLSGTGTISRLNGTGTVTITAGMQTIISSVGGTIAANGRLTLHSDASYDARVLANAEISGNITAERWLTLKRAWRFLASPVNAGSVYNNWQEAGASPSGYGTLVIAPGASVNGLDGGGTAYSLYSYNISNDTWTTIMNTNTTMLNAGTGFRLFSRGDRTIPVGSVTASNQTTLRATGTVINNDVVMKGGTANPAPSATQLSNLNNNVNGWSLVGNPFPSPVDMSSVMSHSQNVFQGQGFYYVWDARIPGANTRGGYVAINITQNDNSVGGSQANKYLQSGEAIFVQTTAANPYMQFMQTDKVTDHNLVLKSTTSTPKVRVQLVRDNTDIADGTYAMFDNAYPATVGYDDAIKFNNLDENIAVRRTGTNLAIETRPEISINDTIPLNVWNLTDNGAYKLHISSENMSSLLNAKLIDHYLNTTTPLTINSQDDYTFTPVAAVPATYGERFEIVFNSVNPLSAADLIISGRKQDKDKVQLNWTITQEKDMVAYDVERSADGENFSKQARVNATANNSQAISYSWTDQQPLKADNYYRIKALRADNTTLYSRTVLVKMGSTDNSSITVFPNPVRNNSFQLQVNGMAAGSYDLKILSVTGQVVLSQKLDHKGGNASYNISLPSELAAGKYQLLLTTDGKQLTTTMMVSK